MKKQLIILIFLGFILSCSKKKKNTNSDNKNLELHINKNETYHYKIGILSPKTRTIITSQAKNSEISALIVDKNHKDIIYNYKPKDDFTGIDFVEIANIEVDKNKIIKTFKIKIIISE